MRNFIVVPVVLVLLAVPATAGAPAGSATNPVKVDDDFFKPKKLTVKKGTRVHWKWTGKDEHDVALWKPGTSINSSDATKRSKIKTKGTFDYKFRIAGKWQVICEVHPDDMRGRVTVTKP